MRSWSVLVLLAVLAGCGVVPSGDQVKPRASSSASQGAPQADGGTSVPESLVSLSCERADDGTWTATGAVRNSGKRAARYEVTVVAGAADGQPQPARTQRLAVLADEKGAFTITGVPGTDDSTCRARLLKLK